MDIERFVDDPERQERVKEVRRKIDELGIDYLYLQFVSVTGRIMGKGIPADHWESIAKKGFQLVYGATVNLFLDRHGDYLGYGPEAMELVGIPEPETFMQLPGTSGSRACGARCSAIARNERIPVLFSPPTPAATFAASTISSRPTMGWSFATAPSRK